MTALRTVGKGLLYAISGALVGFFSATAVSILVLAALDLAGAIKADMTVSYRIVGLSAAALGFFFGFLFAVIQDIRHA